MNGFRLAFGGAQEVIRFQPDLTYLGNIIGRRPARGAYGARAKFMVSRRGATRPDVSGRHLSGYSSGDGCGLRDRAFTCAIIRNLRSSNASPLKLFFWSRPPLLPAWRTISAQPMGSMLPGSSRPAPSPTGLSAAKSDHPCFRTILQGNLEGGISYPPHYSKRRS